MSWTPKDPDAIEFFKFDFTLALASGDSIQGLVSCLSVSGDGLLVITGATLASSNTAVVATFAAGTDRVTYEIECIVDTLLGERLSVTGVLVVRENLK